MPTSGGSVDMFSRTEDTWDRSRFPNKVNMPLKRLIIYALLTLEKSLKIWWWWRNSRILEDNINFGISAGPATESSTINCKVQDPASLERTYEQSGHNRKQTNWFSIEEHFGKRQLQKEWVENFKLEGLASDTKLSFLLKCSPTWSQKHLFVCLFVCFLVVVVENSVAFFRFFFFFWSGGLTELVSTFTNSELETVALYFFFMCVSFGLTAGLAAYTWNTLRA